MVRRPITNFLADRANLVLLFAAVVLELTIAYKGLWRAMHGRRCRDLGGMQFSDNADRSLAGLSRRAAGFENFHGVEKFVLQNDFFSVLL